MQEKQTRGSRPSGSRYARTAGRWTCT